MPLVTVSEVVRFALPAGTDVLAGAGGLGREVTWARVLRVRPTTLSSIEAGEVWLLSAGAVSAVGDARAVARLIREVVEAGVAAFVVHEPLSQEGLDEADRADAPVILVPPEVPLVDVERSIVGFVVDRDRAIGQRVQEVYDRLLATLVEDRGTELLADIVHQVTAKAVYMLDEHFQANVQAGGDERTASAVAHVRRRYWEGQLPQPSDRLVAARLGEDSEPLSVLLRPLVLRGSTEGYLALVGPRPDFGDFDFQIADRTTSVLAIELAKQSAVVEARMRVQGDFLEDLLEEPNLDLEQVIQRARGLGYDLSRPHAVFVLRPRANGGAHSARQQQRFLDVARRRLLMANVASLLRERDGSIHVVAPSPPGVDAQHPDPVAEWVDGLRLDLEAAMAPDHLGIAAGVGRPPGGTVTHHQALREAIQAAEIAATLPGGPATQHFAHLGALRLIFLLAGNPELRAFQRDLLGPLEEYDRGHRSDFVATLDAFFRAGGNHVQAARDLHVHRNTLIYRLERVRELLGGASLDDPDTRLNLQLALRIRAALGAAA